MTIKNLNKAFFNDIHVPCELIIICIMTANLSFIKLTCSNYRSTYFALLDTKIWWRNILGVSLKKKRKISGICILTQSGCS